MGNCKSRSSVKTVPSTVEKPPPESPSVAVEHPGEKIPMTRQLRRAASTVGGGAVSRSCRIVPVLTPVEPLPVRDDEVPSTGSQLSSSDHSAVMMLSSNANLRPVQKHIHRGVELRRTRSIRVAPISDIDELLLLVGDPKHGTASETPTGGSGSGSGADSAIVPGSSGDEVDDDDVDSVFNWRDSVSSLFSDWTSDENDKLDECRNPTVRTSKSNVDMRLARPKAAVSGRRTLPFV